MLYWLTWIPFCSGITHPKFIKYVWLSCPYEILQICSPSTLINVEALEKTFNETTLLSAKGDFAGFVTELTRLKQKINIEMNTNHCTEKKYAIQFFCGALAWPNKEWRITVKTKNQDFLLGDGPPVPSLIPKLSKIVNNMMAEKTWTVNDVDESRKDLIMSYEVLII